MCKTCNPRPETSRAAVLWRSPETPPPEVPRFESIIVTSTSPARACSLAREAMKTVDPALKPGVVFLGSGWTGG